MSQDFLGVPAIPRYLAHVQELAMPPGHRFELYFPVWQPHNWSQKDEAKAEALKSTLPFPASARALLEAYRQRQALLAQSRGERLLDRPAIAVSPFTIGTGIEHPLENGFSFLKPYGLPYLPGSGVKGVLRRAAEELSQMSNAEERGGWDQEAVDTLFGREVLKEDIGAERNRGALIFWDVLPAPPGDSLEMEIINPHFGDYYRGHQPPHDAGKPIPNFFLSLPAGTRYHFYVEWRPPAQAAAGCEQWRDLMTKAFEHAFDWLGFGAKTSVGYGHLRLDEESIARQAEQERERRRQEEEAQRLAQLPPIERDFQQILADNTNTGAADSVVLEQALSADRWQGEEKIEAARRIKALMENEGKWQLEPKRDRKGNVKRGRENRDYERTQRVLAILDGQSP